ncbi:MAG: hypothetical protein M1813_006790 [Trichoglossum hirsutum]|nr:MAG: hypothetical protein M1813_006790 [Trichoglossum hirsutum]
MCPQRPNVNPGGGSPERSRSIQTPRVSTLRRDGEPGSSSTTQAGNEIHRNASSSGVSRSDLLPPPDGGGLGTTPSRTPQPTDAPDPRTLSERLAEAAWGAMFVNIPPLNSSEESRSSSGHANSGIILGANRANTGGFAPSQLGHPVSTASPAPPTTGLGGLYNSGDQGFPPLSPVGVGNPHNSAADRPSQFPLVLRPTGDINYNPQRETSTSQLPRPGTSSDKDSSITHTPCELYADGIQAIPSPSGAVRLTRWPSAKRGPRGYRKETTPPTPSHARIHRERRDSSQLQPAGPSADQLVDSDRLLDGPATPHQAAPLDSRNSEPLPQQHVGVAASSNGGQEGLEPQDQNTSPVKLEHTSGAKQRTGGESSRARESLGVPPRSFRGRPPPGIPMPTVSPYFRPADWGTAPGGSGYFPEPFRDGDEECYPRTPVYQPFPEERPDFGAAGSEFPSRKPHRATTVSSWRRKTKSNAVGLKELSKKAAGQTNKIAKKLVVDVPKNLVQSGKKALGLAAPTDQERYERYLHISSPLREGVDLRALELKRARNPKRLTSEELRVLAMEKMEVDYAALEVGSQKSDINRSMSDGGVRRWQAEIAAFERKESMGHPSLVGTSVSETWGHPLPMPPQWFLTTPEGLDIAPGVLQQKQEGGQNATFYTQKVASQGDPHAGQDPMGYLHAPPILHPSVVPHPPPPLPHQHTLPPMPQRQDLTEGQLQIDDMSLGPRGPLPENTPPGMEARSILSARVTSSPDSRPAGKPYELTEERIAAGCTADDEDWDPGEIKRTFGRKNTISDPTSELDCSNEVEGSEHDGRLEGSIAVGEEERMDSRGLTPGFSPRGSVSSAGRALTADSVGVDEQQRLAAPSADGASVNSPRVLSSGFFLPSSPTTSPGSSRSSRSRRSSRSSTESRPLGLGVGRGREEGVVGEVVPEEDEGEDEEGEGGEGGEDEDEDEDEGEGEDEEGEVNEENEDEVEEMREEEGDEDEDEDKDEGEGEGEDEERLLIDVD